MESYLAAAAVRAFDVRWCAIGADGEVDQAFSGGVKKDRPYTVVWRPRVGRTLAATRALPCGALVFGELPLIVARDTEGLGEAMAVATELLRGGPVMDVAARLLQTAQHPTAQARAELRAAAADLLAKRGDEQPPCTLEQAVWALGLAAVNTHGAGDCAVLGLLSSMPQHDCDPNCFIHVGPRGGGSELTLRTTRHVAAGEALCISYCPIYLPRSVRRAQLYEQHGFVCECERCAGGHPEHVRAFCCPSCGGGPASPTSPCPSCRSLACDACGALNRLSDARWSQLEQAEAPSGVLSPALHPYHHAWASILRNNLSSIRDAAERARAYQHLAGGLTRLAAATGGSKTAAGGPSSPLVARDLEGAASALRTAGDPRALCQLREAAHCWEAAGRAPEAARCLARLAKWEASAASEWASGALGASKVHNSRERGLAAEPAGGAWAALRAEPPAALDALRMGYAEALAAGAHAMSTRDCPVVVTGFDRGSTPEELSAACGSVSFSLAPDVSLPLDEVLAYAELNTADTPYYLVVKTFEGEKAALLEGFEAPDSIFGEDVLASVPGSQQARYLFIGSMRSGTFLHTDPLCTSAWNVCSHGLKRWCFIAPETDLERFGLRHFTQGRRQSQSVWFADVYPRLQAAAERDELRMVECLQRRGDVVYVPAGIGPPSGIPSSGLFLLAADFFI